MTAAHYQHDALALVSREESRSGADPAFRDGIVARLTELATMGPEEVVSTGETIVQDIRLWIEPRMLARMGM